jgi:hypothetical protein
VRTLGLSLVLLLPGCGSGDDCTELGCDNDASITFSGGRVDVAYDLVVETDGGTFMARCSDPGSPDVANNDPEVQCSATGFTLEGAAALGHSLRVTILPVEMDPVVEGAEVLLSVVDERHPNGEDCPPTCYSRAGQLSL